MTYPLPDGVDQTSSWPYEKYPAHDRRTGPWTVWMDAGGALALFPTGDRAPEGMLTVVRGEEDTLRRALVMFCGKGWETDERYVHQNGTVWLFNWRSFTMSQIAIAAQVFGLFMDGKVTEAWAVGRAFGGQINAAVEAGRK